MISMEKMDVKQRDHTGYDGIEVTSRLMNIILEMPLDQQLDLLERLDSNGYNGTRKYVRTYLKNPWVVAINDEEQALSDDNYFIKDIGRCGMFIEPAQIDQSFGLGETITMRFKMPASKKMFKIVGQIVRFQQNGMGVKFLRQLSED
ncbi:MAG: PilZ domain-containing protein [Pseudomonadota bacterium]